VAVFLVKKFLQGEISMGYCYKKGVPTLEEAKMILEEAEKLNPIVYSNFAKKAWIEFLNRIKNCN